MNRQSVLALLSGVVVIGLRLNANTIDFTKIGSFVIPSLSIGGVTVTGSGNLAILDQNGLGIAQSNGGIAVFEGQFLDFSFASGAAVGIAYFVGACGSNTPFQDTVCGQATLESFGVDGGSLGTAVVNGIGTHNVSSLFADELISRFMVTTDVVSGVPGNSFRITTLTYEPVTIPEPRSITLLGITFAGVGFASHLRRRKNKR